LSYDLKVLEQGCEELGIALNDTQKQQFIAFYEYLVEKNKVIVIKEQLKNTNILEMPAFKSKKLKMYDKLTFIRK
jgi:16S rRNA G527 N7-methylase RsmG